MYAPGDELGIHNRITRDGSRESPVRSRRCAAAVSGDLIHESECLPRLEPSSVEHEGGADPSVCEPSHLNKQGGLSWSTGNAADPTMLA